MVRLDLQVCRSGEHPFPRCSWLEDAQIPEVNHEGRRQRIKWFRAPLDAAVTIIKGDWRRWVTTGKLNWDASTAWVLLTLEENA